MKGCTTREKKLEYHNASPSNVPMTLPMNESEQRLDARHPGIVEQTAVPPHLNEKAPDGTRRAKQKGIERDAGGGELPKREQNRKQGQLAQKTEHSVETRGLACATDTVRSVVDGRTDIDIRVWCASTLMRGPGPQARSK